MLYQNISLGLVAVVCFFAMSRFSWAGPMECADHECTIDYSGSSRVNLVVPKGNTKVHFIYNGSGRVNVATEKPDDTIDELEVDCVGSARVDLRKLKTKIARVKYRGSADLLLNVTEKAVVRNNGSGDIDVEGSGKLEVTGHGSGSVNPS